LLSFAEECLLLYPAARRCLERAMELAGRREKKDLKRLAQLRECAGQWSRLGLTPLELAQLGEYLASRLESQDCDRTLRLTRQWLVESGVAAPDSILAAFADRGGWCDCEVLSNVVHG